MDTHYHAVVVGTGFGGSVMAYRLAEAGLRVCVLERGQAYPPGSFPRTPREMRDSFWDPSEGLYGMYSVWSLRGLEALVASGLGGGSLIYANVLRRKDEKWFVREDLRLGGYEYWPVTRADLDPHYDRVERMIGVQLYPLVHPPYDRTPKLIAMQEAARATKLDWQLVPLGIAFGDPERVPAPGEPIPEAEPNLHGRTRYTCRLCGECCIGCNYGSKNTLDYNYLSAAKRLDAELRTLCEVRNIAPRTGGGFAIRYVRHDLAHAGRRFDTSTLPKEEITADRLILAAGALGTTFLLLKNRGAFPAIGDALGTRFSGNGDLLTFITNCHQRSDGKRVPRPMSPSFGPVSTSAIRIPDALDGGEGRGCYIEDAGIPPLLEWVLEASGPASLARRLGVLLLTRLRTVFGGDPRSNLASDVAMLLRGCERSFASLPLIGVGRDTPNGRLRLAHGWLDIEWRDGRSKSYYERLRSTMKTIARAWQGDLRAGLLRYLKRAITFDPLGGCPMGRDESEGVVDEYGQVFNYPGLYIADGSVMPGPVGTNPALTIAALADRFADRVLEDWRASPVTSACRQPSASPT